MLDPCRWGAHCLAMLEHAGPVTCSAEAGLGGARAARPCSSTALAAVMLLLPLGCVACASLSTSLQAAHATAKVRQRRLQRSAGGMGGG